MTTELYGDSSGCLFASLACRSDISNSAAYGPERPILKTLEAGAVSESQAATRETAASPRVDVVRACIYIRPNMDGGSRMLRDACNGATHLACSLDSHAIGQEVSHAPEMRISFPSQTGIHRGGRRQQHRYPQHAVQRSDGGFMSGSIVTPCPPRPRFWAESPFTIRRRASRAFRSLPPIALTSWVFAPPPCSLSGEPVLSLPVLSEAAVGRTYIQPLAASYIRAVRTPSPYWIAAMTGSLTI